MHFPRRISPRPLCLLLLVAMLALTGCIDLDDDGRFPSEPMGQDPIQQWAPGPQWGDLQVEYRSSVVAGDLEGALSNLSERDLFKLATHTAQVRAVPMPDAYTTRVALFIDGRHHASVDLDEQMPDVPVTVELPIDTSALREGVHPVRFYAYQSNGQVVAGGEEIRVLLNVTAMTAPRNGVFWLGTFEYGLAAYALGTDPADPSDDRALAFGAVNVGLDPQSTRQHLESDGPGVAGHAIASLAQDDAGRLWIGTLDGGLSVLEDHGTVFTPEDDWYGHFFPSEVASALSLDDQQDILHLFRANSVTAILPEGETGLWLATFHGLFYFDHAGTIDDTTDDTWTFFQPDGNYDRNISKLARDAAGRIWVASFDLDANSLDRNAISVLDPAGTPSRVDDDRWGAFERLTATMPNKVYTIAVDAQDLVWIGTTDGLFVLDHHGTPFDASDDTFARRGTEHGLPDNDVAAVLPLQDGTVWVGSYDVCGGAGGGLSLIDLTRNTQATNCGGDASAQLRCSAVMPALESVVVTYTTEDGMLDSDISSITLLEDGSVLVGTFNLLSAPAVTQLFGYFDTDIEQCAVTEEGPEQDPNLRNGPERVMVGKDGLTLIDMGGSVEDKADDNIVNL